MGAGASVPGAGAPVGAEGLLPVVVGGAGVAASAFIGSSAIYCFFLEAVPLASADRVVG